MSIDKPDTVPAYGWGLTADTGSGRFYHVVVADRVVVIHHGTAHGDGHTVLVQDSCGAARDHAVRVSSNKAARGFQLSHDVAAWSISRHRLDGLTADPAAGAKLAGSVTQAVRTLCPKPRLGSASWRDIVGRLFDRLGELVAADAARPAATGWPESTTVALPPVGSTFRPGGQLYQPRLVGGHEDLAVLRRARGLGENVLLEGPQGAGKTAMVEAAFGTQLEQVTCTADTTEADLVGTWVPAQGSGDFTWVAGPVQRSVERDVPLFIDEIAIADPRVLTVLYPLMDDRRVLRITANPALAPIPAGAGWITVGAYNPDVPGAVLSDPLRDRFAHHIEVCSDLELVRRLQVPEPLVQVVASLEARRAEGTLSWAPQTRALLRFRSLARGYGTQYAAASLVGAAPKEARDEVAAAVATVFPGVAALRLEGPAS